MHDVHDQLAQCNAMQLTIWNFLKSNVKTININVNDLDQAV